GLSTRQRALEDAREKILRMVDNLVGPSSPGAEPGWREVVVTGYDAQQARVTEFRPQTRYTLRFYVGEPLGGNLAQGKVGINSVPAAGLQAHWIVSSINVEFLEVSKGQVQKRSGTWLAEFDLDIPGQGESTSVSLVIRTTDAPGELTLIILCAGEEYRRLTV